MYNVRFHRRVLVACACVFGRLVGHVVPSLHVAFPSFQLVLKTGEIQYPNGNLLNRHFLPCLQVAQCLPHDITMETHIVHLTIPPNGMSHTTRPKKTTMDIAEKTSQPRTSSNEDVFASHRRAYVASTLCVDALFCFKYPFYNHHINHRGVSRNS